MASSDDNMRVAMAGLLCLAPFAALAADAPGGQPAQEKPDRPPVHVAYDMPMNGFVALDIHDKAGGKFVRRLVGETARWKGPVEENWDLKPVDHRPLRRERQRHDRHRSRRREGMESVRRACPLSLSACSANC